MSTVLVHFLSILKRDFNRFTPLIYFCRIKLKAGHSYRDLHICIDLSTESSVNSEYSVIRFSVRLTTVECSFKVIVSVDLYKAVFDQRCLYNSTRFSQSYCVQGE